MKYGDVMFGAVGAFSTYVIGHFNEVLAGAVGIISLFVMLLRLRREWRYRNERPPKQEEEI